MRAIRLSPSAWLLPAVLVAAFALGGCAADGAATATGDAEERAVPGLRGGLREGASAPEFAGLGPWLNTEPLTMAGLQQERRVVLVDFWTYTCVNCIRTLPFLKDWHEKYADLGLTIVGVHSPEFEFEKDEANVARAVTDEGIAYPVAQDNDWGTWEAFDNNVWPAKYLFSADGYLTYRHFGEGDYIETEEAIRDALVAAGADVSGIEVGGVPEPELDPEVEGITRELYFGYQRNFHPAGIYAAQEIYYAGPDQTLNYTDPFAAGAPAVGADEERSHNRWYAHGRWRNEAEGFVHARETEALEDYIAFRFLARTVNPVMHPAEGDRAYEVVIELDGRPVLPEEAGADVTWDAEGRSMVRVDEPRMYRVLELPELADGVITLRSNAEGFSIYAVTFGAYTEGP